MPEPYIRCAPPTGVSQNDRVRVDLDELAARWCELKGRNVPKVRDEDWAAFEAPVHPDSDEQRNEGRRDRGNDTPVDRHFVLR